MFLSLLSSTRRVAEVMDEPLQTVREQLQNFYEKQILLPNYVAKKTCRDELKMRAVDFLDHANPSERLDRAITRILLDQSASIPSWGAISCVMLCMEQYAINLLSCPWKKEFHKILTYSGFYKTKLKSCLQDSALEKLFSIIWYQRIANSFVLKSLPQQPVLVHAALNFYLAAVECENYSKVHAAFSSRGLSTVGAMQFRHSHRGSFQTCCDIIRRRYSTSVEERWEELRGRSAVPSCSVDMDGSMTTGEWKDPHGTNHSTAVENNSVWERTGTLEEHAEISRELLAESRPRYKSPRERRRASRELADDIEQITLVQGPVVSPFNDSSVYESFSSAETERLAESAYEDHTGSLVSKEEHLKLGSLVGRDRAQTSYDKQWIDRFDRIPSGNGEEAAAAADMDKEYRRFISVQDRGTNAELALNEKTNRQLSFDEGSCQVISEKRERSKRLRRSAKQKGSMGKMQQCDTEAGDQQSVSRAQREVQRDSETRGLNREQQRSGRKARWQCEACTLVNKPSESVCRACNRSRHCVDDAPLKTGGRQCNQCTFVNSSTAEKCEICDNDLNGSSTYV